MSSEPLHSYWVRLVLSCFCILLEQYRFLGLEPLRGATVGRLEVISSRLGVFSDRVGANLTRFGIMLVCLGSISGGWPS